MLFFALFVSVALGGCLCKDDNLTDYAEFDGAACITYEWAVTKMLELSDLTSDAEDAACQILQGVYSAACCGTKALDKYTVPPLAANEGAVILKMYDNADCSGDEIAVEFDKEEMVFKVDTCTQVKGSTTEWYKVTPNDDCSEYNYAEYANKECTGTATKQEGTEDHKCKKVDGSTFTMEGMTSSADITLYSDMELFANTAACGSNTGGQSAAKVVDDAKGSGSIFVSVLMVVFMSLFKL